MSYYTVRRDDSEIRVVICPKCSTKEHPVANVVKFDDVIPYKFNSYLLKLMQCNLCKTYFSFYREDGVAEITEEKAMEGLKQGRCDMRENGEDCHGHSFYIVFKNKPPTISEDKYYDLIGLLEKKDGSYSFADDIFEKFIKVLPSVNFLVRYRDLLTNIDFENMNYLEIKGKLFDYFEKG
jgi:hypothetical protein